MTLDPDEELARAIASDAAKYIWTARGDRLEDFRNEWSGELPVHAAILHRANELAGEALDFGEMADDVYDNRPRRQRHAEDAPELAALIWSLNRS